MLTRDVSVGSATLSVTDAGEGTPIVFLHAFPLAARMWASQLQALPAGWRGLAPDLRGFGSSRGRVPARDMAAHAEDVLALATGLDAGPVVLAGLSMGGYIAFECWRRRPSMIRGLVLADTRAEADTADGAVKRVAMQEMARQSGTAAVIDAMLPALLGATSRTGNPHLAVQVREWAMQTPVDGVIDALDALRTRPDSRPTLASITCPTLVIVGDEDTITPPALAAVIAEGISGATLTRIPGAGHLSNVEQPETFNAALAGWLTTMR